MNLIQEDVNLAVDVVDVRLLQQLFLFVSVGQIIHDVFPLLEVEGQLLVDGNFIILIFLD